MTKSTMSLHVYTDRIGSDDPDAIDVTARSGHFLAPSWNIVRPVVDARKRIKKIIAEHKAKRLAPIDTHTLRTDILNAIEDEAWATYVPLYLHEMRSSYRANRPQWDALLNRKRVVLLCYCTRAEHCHRHLLRTRILPRCGAVDMGEIV